MRVFTLGEHVRVTIVPECCLCDILPGELAPPLPGFAGFSVAVRDIVETRSYLNERGVPVVETPAGEIMVPSIAGLGTAIIFRQL
ncbi:hypothetical protein I6N90_13315 [Paenibacillus sp. GSMTC-2017]|uniref:hypothetical protein n=1 Tax=Paenibacillus sp. GSMTC-2017 TaxID=2794350 RepID=UPI0018D9B7DF|nr:hypothetical protein [Paenibacillus sp. GSMTC-2017]MBH5318780.1 hypothetical protein [Paenibacillus sp. GSMTC-2017]